MGEGGIIPLTDEYLFTAPEAGPTGPAPVLVFDEIQCGLGRTGKALRLPAERRSFPNIVTLAKPLGGGLPLGAVLTGGRHRRPGQAGTSRHDLRRQPGRPAASAWRCSTRSRTPAHSLQRVETYGDWFQAAARRPAGEGRPPSSRSAAWGMMWGIELDRPRRPRGPASSSAKAFVVGTARADRVLRLPARLTSFQKKALTQFITALEEVVSPWGDRRPLACPADAQAGAPVPPQESNKEKAA